MAGPVAHIAESARLSCVEVVAAWAAVTLMRACGRAHGACSSRPPGVLRRLRALQGTGGRRQRSASTDQAVAGLTG
jgi:hypothetical protein